MIGLLKIACVGLMLSAAPLVGAQIGRHLAGSAGLASPAAERSQAAGDLAAQRRSGSVHFKNQNEPAFVGNPSQCCAANARREAGQWI